MKLINCTHSYKTDGNQCKNLFGIKIKQEYKSKTNYNGKQKMIDVLQFCAAQCTHCYDASHLERKWI
jgi:hypothetical protein